MDVDESDDSQLCEDADQEYLNIDKKARQMGTKKKVYNCFGDKNVRRKKQNTEECYMREGMESLESLSLKNKTQETSNCQDASNNFSSEREFVNLDSLERCCNCWCNDIHLCNEIYEDNEESEYEPRNKNIMTDTSPSCETFSGNTYVLNTILSRPVLKDQETECESRGRNISTDKSTFTVNTCGGMSHRSYKQHSQKYERPQSTETNFSEECETEYDTSRKNVSTDMNKPNNCTGKTYIIHHRADWSIETKSSKNEESDCEPKKKNNSTDMNIVPLPFYADFQENAHRKLYKESNVTKSIETKTCKVKIHKICNCSCCKKSNSKHLPLCIPARPQPPPRPIHIPPPPPPRQLPLPSPPNHLPPTSTNRPSCSPRHLPLPSPQHLPPISRHLPPPSRHLPPPSRHIPQRRPTVSPHPLPYLPPSEDPYAKCNIGEKICKCPKCCQQIVPINVPQAVSPTRRHHQPSNGSYCKYKPRERKKYETEANNSPLTIRMHPDNYHEGQIRKTPARRKCPCRCQLIESYRPQSQNQQTQTKDISNDEMTDYICNCENCCKKRFENDEPSYDCTSYYSEPESDSNDLSLPYQNTDEYMELLEELEKRLLCRNRNRVLKTLVEFENCGQQNKSPRKSHTHHTEDNRKKNNNETHSPKHCQKKCPLEPKCKRTEYRCTSEKGDWDQEYHNSVRRNCNLPSSRVNNSKWRMIRTGDWQKVEEEEDEDDCHCRSFSDPNSGFMSDISSPYT